MRLLGAALVCALAACGVSTASSQRKPAPASAPDALEVVAPEARGVSATELDRLAQLLTAPRPAPAPPAPEEPPAPSGPPYKTGPRPESPVITPPPALGPGDATVYAVGDSVLLSTDRYLPTTLGSGWNLRFDARISRRFPEGIEVIRENRASLGQVAVILLGHNYGGGGWVLRYLDELMLLLRDVQRVVFVTVAEFAPAQEEVNRAIHALPSLYRNVVVAEWAAVAAANPQFLREDGVHLSGSGAIALSNLIAVMVGPAPPRDGRVPPPPRLLPIPDEPVVTTTTSAPAGTTTSIEPRETSTTTRAVTSTTSSTSSSAPSSTSTSSSSSSSTAPTSLPP